MPDGATGPNGLGLEPTPLPDGRLVFSINAAAMLLGVSRSTVEGRTKLGSDADAYLPSDVLASGGSRPMRWILAGPVLAQRAKLLALLGASERLPEDEEQERPTAIPADAEPKPNRASSESSGEVQPRIAELEEQARVLADARSLLAASEVSVVTDRTSQIAALEEEVRMLQANMRDMLAVDEAKTDIIRRHLPIESLND